MNNNLIAFIGFVIAYISFFLSLEKCTEGEDRCCMKFSWMKVKVIEESISCIISIILLQSVLIKKISKLHIFHFIITFSLFYIYSDGIDFDNHGYYNIKYFFIIVLSIILLINSILYLLFLKNIKIIILYIEFLILLF